MLHHNIDGNSHGGALAKWGSRRPTSDFGFGNKDLGIFTYVWPKSSLGILDIISRALERPLWTRQIDVVLVLDLLKIAKYKIGHQESISTDDFSSHTSSLAASLLTLCWLLISYRLIVHIFCKRKISSWYYLIPLGRFSGRSCEQRHQGVREGRVIWNKMRN